MSRPLTYEEAVSLYESLYGAEEFAQFEAAWAKWGATVETEDIVSVLNATGDLKYGKWVADSWVAPTHNANNNITGYTTEFEVTTPNVVDSNNAIRGKIKTPINTTTQVVEGRNVMSARVGLREAGKFAIGEVVPAVLATGIGITLGKQIDSTLYDLNPDFWDSHNMSSLNPDTWNNITSDYDGVAGKLFDVVFGINSDGTSQAYIDEDALAYMAWYMAEQGALTAPLVTYNVDDPTGLTLPHVSLPITEAIFPIAMFNESAGANKPMTITVENNSESVTGALFVAPSGQWNVEIVSDASFTMAVTYFSGYVSRISAQQRTLNGKTFYDASWGSAYNTSWSTPYPLPSRRNTSTGMITSTAEYTSIGYVLAHGTRTETGAVPGITNQSDATQPDPSNWNSLENTKTGLQQQYPQLWDNAKHQDYVDENGENKHKTLIPINLPNAKNPLDNKPTSGNRSQTDPLIDPDTATEDLLKTITDLITGNLMPNPPSTGSGDSPVVPVPTGSASSLWKIYNPTQAQIDAFGSWLWSSDFVDQIKKLFSDPMQGIIGVHKVFASPSIGGTSTIKVGYLDSQVSSNYVDNQYTSINCGTVSLSEYFGNVFDYSPYTKVSLYLPFIGIVDLDVADVMRSKISVKYHVDVLSGACLADVKVTRDLADAVLYQYSGSAIVTYPVSSGNYMGMVAGVLSVASGVAGTILSGGALAPALIGGAVGMSHLHTDVSHSGGFSGCAGAMAGKKPYLIVSRPQTAMADNYGHFTGKPANSHVILRNCSGMTRVKSVYVGNVNATDEEKDMIENQLKAGVII